ncbi:MAG: VOC family protein [Candidatus Kapabacteria bacterium]|nr:VOC family protein [Ignavibacteriota bacterium]MCW5885926.1 VOC family protein [Candidatus Kapabacteria bacterium]
MKAALSFFEIPAQNYERAVKFYSDVFDFSINTCKCEDEIMGMIDSEPIAGAIFYKEGYEPGKKGIIISFHFAEISPILEKVEKYGGEILVSKTEITDEQGHFTLIMDSEGNRIGLHSK